MFPQVFHTAAGICYLCGMPRYPAPYPMIRPIFPPRPFPPTGVIPPMPRPPIPGIWGLPPVATPIVRPIVPVSTPMEKPQTTVYVGKIATTVENEFLLSILTLCGPVKSWKRAQDPSDGTLKAFGFCEFESAEGVLRSLRLLSKLNIDGQELMLNINQATREYLERYVENKAETEKQEVAQTGDPANERDSKESTEKQGQSANPMEEGTKKDSEDKENQVGNKSFGLVTDEDREFDAVALEKLTGMLEERLKSKPLPPPMLVDGTVKSTSDTPSKSKDGDSDIDIMKGDAAEEKNDDDNMSENKPATESDKPETPDRSKRHDSRSQERDRERDLKREKERELERVEREREREKVRRERERERELREVERLYKDRLKEWEAREREKEYQRQYEKEREKERERERWKEIVRQEDESSGDDGDDSRKRRRRTSLLEEKRRKRQHEKEEDFEDRLKEKEEIAEAKRRATEEQPKLVTKQLKLESKSLDQVTPEDETAMQDENFERKHIESSHANDVSRNGLNDVDAISGNSSGDDLNMMAPIAVSDKKQNNNAPARKLGFGLIGSGKRTTVPSVFHEEDDEDLDEKKMRPLVPIDYSTEELQAVQANASGSQSNLAAAAEFAKRISGANPKDAKADTDRERSRRSSGKQNLRDRDWNDDESSRSKDESREKMHNRNIDRERGREDKPKTGNKKLLDAKQLIDMIPKTKEELFVYEINWDVYDKHHLHERMRPWISKKITEFLGEEEATLVDYIVSCIKDHVQASTMLEMLQSILDDEAEMFVLKTWRMLIFEIKKVETGLSMKSKS
ncbi:RNA-binding protein 25-like isoform X3 [Zingiber officinale]|uniref:RNA-binding protein 25-like isoform X3 n=1 Tax=Zingiber officinale TaxID=94328 RepID=UPI001C4D8391|nr:RNA-binding protein 25-like isoform X3 [Zingiber officinale]XP_042446776.1 RNA-binding protein 25-like isoform X3 [Zingiber officinale]XP_042446777.1 RNA-binding protein 25-like isoform X3 [Zingiber officinale]XP_042446778.1 RNA-binding protein 25-like isoform X3 [Zingiber officinale]XP_042446779.1 RNA-binding protein 25-like isoform X3 [Zingiber officinale]